MSTPIPLFVELAAGLAGLSLRLQGGPRARPPVSRPGNKVGYSSPIFGALGLRHGQGADAYLWTEPCSGCRALLHAYCLPEVRAEAAGHLRRWADEDARALWERLRAEGEVKGVDGREVARWVIVDQWSRPGRNGEGWYGPGATSGGTWGQEGRDKAISRERFARLLESLVPMAAVIAEDAREVEPIDLPEGTVAYLDPSYQGTTGYKENLTREETLELARRWSDAGAIVAVSEAVPLPLEGWHHVEITGERHGQKRTFSKQQREWLTMNRAPAIRPARQTSLFGADVAL